MLSSQSKPQHSLEKREDSLETRAVLMVFSVEIETVGVVVQTIYQYSKKW